MATSTITLEVKDDGSATIDKISGKLAAMEQQAKQGAAGMSGALDTLKQNWFAVTAAVTAAGLTFNKLFSLAEGAAQLEENVGRLARQTGEFDITARQLAESVQAVVNGQLSFAESVKLSGQALAQSFSPEQVVQFAKLAEVASDVLGGTVAQAFDTLVTSVATGRTAVLKQIGVLVDLEAEKQTLALSTNRLASEISLVEEKQILLNAVMAKAPMVLQTLGEATMSTADQMTRFKADASDVTDKVGGYILKIGQFAFGFGQLMSALGASDDRKKSPQALELFVQGLKNMSLEADETAPKIENQIVKTQRLGDAMVDLFHHQQDLLKAVNVGSQAHHVAAFEMEMEKKAATKLAEALGILAQAEAADKEAALTAGGGGDALSRIRQKAFSGAPLSLAEIKQLQSTVSGLKDTGPVSFDDGLNADQRKIQASIRAGTTGVPGAAPGGGGEESSSTFQSDQERLQRDLQTLLLSTAGSQAIAQQRQVDAGGTIREEASQFSGATTFAPWFSTVPGGFPVSVKVNVGGEAVAAVVERQQRANDLARIGTE